MNRLNLVQHRSMTPQLVSVISGKGGVGKSVIAYNLAERLVTAGARVLLVDTDFTTGNLHLLANCACDAGIGAYLSGQLGLRETVMELQPRFALLPSPVTLSSEDMINTKSVGSAMKRLRADAAEYDFVIIDNSSGVHETTDIVAHASDINLIVIVPEITSIADGYGLYKHLLQVNKNIRCRLLINRIADDNEIKFISLKFSAVTERFLARPITCIGIIPEDDTIRKAVAGQATIASVSPLAPSITALTRLANELLQGRGGIPQLIINRENTINNQPARADIRG